MIVDGRALRDEIGEELRTKGRAGLLRSPKLRVILAGEDAATMAFVRQKRIFAERIGVVFEEVTLPGTTTTEEILAAIQRTDADGIVVQLPLPPQIDTEKVLAAIPQEKDVDALGRRPIVPPPVALAVEEILRRHDVDVRGMNAVVVGKGRLVGMPVGAWLESEGAMVTYADRSTNNLFALTRAADIVVTGAGVPGIITTKMLKDGVIVIDAATSEATGKVVGDCEPECAEKAKLFTPVPGGVGPVTVAALFKNLVDLAGKHQ